ncbi:ArnT family glycosyltransferase [Nocardia sp. 004]|uniref:ArnT family glycosyltransferase n=1 Tax=Nocardia sp. 004 TaxID=3385978 RepID=UPI0039A35E9A
MALRIPAVSTSVAVVALSAVIARELGGDRRAQVLTAIACTTSAFVLGQAQTLSTNGIDTLLWAVLTWLPVRWVRTRNDALLLTAGLVTAVAVQVERLIPLFWIAVIVVVGWLGSRALLRRPALWWSGGIVLLAAAPGLIWQARHGWPYVGMRSVVRGQTGGFAGSLWFVGGPRRSTPPPPIALLHRIMAAQLRVCRRFSVRIEASAISVPRWTRPKPSLTSAAMSLS